jgi:hypothetical protein
MLPSIVARTCRLDAEAFAAEAHPASEAPGALPAEEDRVVAQHDRIGRVPTADRDRACHVVHQDVVLDHLAVGHDDPVLAAVHEDAVPHHALRPVQRELRRMVGHRVDEVLLLVVVVVQALVEDEPVDDRAGVVAVAFEREAAARALEVRGAQQPRRVRPRRALGELGVIAAEQRDVGDLDLPAADLQLAVVLALGDVDRVAGFALLERLERIAEGLLLAAVAARGCRRARTSRDLAGASWQRPRHPRPTGRSARCSR